MPTSPTHVARASAVAERPIAAAIITGTNVNEAKMKPFRVLLMRKKLAMATKFAAVATASRRSTNPSGRRVRSPRAKAGARRTTATDISHPT